MSKRPTTPVEDRILALPGSVTADLIHALSDRNADVKAFAFAIVEARLAKGVKKVNMVALTAARDAAVAGTPVPQRATTLKKKSPRKAVAPAAEVDPLAGMEWDDNDMLV